MKMKYLALGLLCSLFIGSISDSQSISWPSRGGGGSAVINSVSAPLALSGGVLSIPQATSTQSGFLASSDFNTFETRGSSTNPFASLYAHIFDAVDTNHSNILGGVLAGYSTNSTGITLPDGTNKAALVLINGNTTSQNIGIYTANASGGTSSDVFIESGTGNVSGNLNLIPGVGTTTSGNIRLGNSGAQIGYIPEAQDTLGSLLWEAPLSVIPQANTTASGYLSSTDWNTFNNKGSGTYVEASPTACTSESSGVTSTSFVTASNSPTLTFTPTHSGTCRIDMTTMVRPSSADGGEIRVFKTAGTGTSLNINPVGVYNLGASLYSAVYTVSYYTVTGGSSVTFDVQLRSNGGSAFYLDCSEQSGDGSFIFAECF